MKMRELLLIAACLLTAAAWASDDFATLRGGAIDREASAPKINRVVNNDVRPSRAYPMQPPIIPHKIDGYQVDLNVNRCMACHSRRQTETSGAVAISVTHYMDREGNFLADISPRRYFCEQCHVVQTEARPLLANEFIDVDELRYKATTPRH